MADEKALDSIMKLIDKQYGDGAIMKMGDKRIVETEAIPTGSFSLDLSLGIGGIPKGRIIEIFGAEASGKTTLALHIIAECQKKGGVGAFIDAEHALDPVYARNVGVDIDNLLISQPDTGEQALEITDMLIKSGAVDIVVVDSVAALVPKAELEGEMGDVHMGLQARLMSQGMRKLAGNVNRSRASIVFINQVREKIGVMFGSPITTPGGRALKFASSVRLEVRRIESIKQGMDIIGSRTQVKVVKNKFAPPFRKSEFDIYFGEGICPASDVLELALSNKIIQQKGSWFTYGEERLGQGRERVRQTIKDSPELYNDLSLKVREAMGLPANGAPIVKQAKGSKKAED